jgi:competence protein ComEC
MTGIFSREFRRTTLMAALFGSMIVGIGLARLISFPVFFMAVAAVPLAASMMKRNFWMLIAVILFGVCVGGFRGTGSMHELSRYDGIYGRKVTIVGTAANDATYGRQSQLAFDLTSARLGASDLDLETALTGTIGVSGFGENAIFRGDRVVVTGKLKAGTGSHQGWMSYAELQAIDHDTSPLNTIRRRFGAGMTSALPEPLGSFGMGLLIGGHSTLPDDVYNDLLMVGLVHIIAVSGYNLTIILRAAMRLFGKRSKYQTTLFSVTLILVFLLLTGSSASIVRASIVSLLSLAAWYYGRTFKPLLLILLAAAGTALVNPLYVWGDMGWYLSFLAFYGVLVLGPLVTARFIPGRLRENLLVGVGIESICAEIMTLPLVLHIFGQMSLVSLLANIVIAAAVPLAMLVAVVAGIAGTFMLPVAGWFAWPAVILLTYMLDTAHLLAGIPHVFLEDIGFSLAAMVISYAVVLGFNLVLHSQSKRNRAIISEDSKDMPLLFRPGHPQRNFFEDNALTANT